LETWGRKFGSHQIHLQTLPGVPSNGRKLMHSRVFTQNWIRSQCFNYRGARWMWEMAT
jgi:hypothetical protein